MNILTRVTNRLRDMNCLKNTGLKAEEIAHEMGEDLVGAEHWLLAALDLPDGTAGLAFERIGADASGLRAAIEQQYDDALRELGIQTEALNIPEHLGAANRKKKPIIFQAQASTNALFARFAEEIKNNKKSPFMGATVVQAAGRLTKGTLPRALHTMGIDGDMLSAAAAEIIAERIYVPNQSNCA